MSVRNTRGRGTTVDPEGSPEVSPEPSPASSSERSPPPSPADKKSAAAKSTGKKSAAKSTADKKSATAAEKKSAPKSATAAEKKSAASKPPAPASPAAAEKKSDTENKKRKMENNNNNGDVLIIDDKTTADKKKQKKDTGTAAADKKNEDEKKLPNAKSTEGSGEKMVIDEMTDAQQKKLKDAQQKENTAKLLKEAFAFDQTKAPTAASSEIEYDNKMNVYGVRTALRFAEFIIMGSRGPRIITRSEMRNQKRSKKFGIQNIWYFLFFIIDFIGSLIEESKTPYENAYTLLQFFIQINFSNTTYFPFTSCTSVVRITNISRIDIPDDVMKAVYMLSSHYFWSVLDQIKAALLLMDHWNNTKYYYYTFLPTTTAEHEPILFYFRYQTYQSINCLHLNRDLFPDRSANDRSLVSAQKDYVRFHGCILPDATHGPSDEVCSASLRDLIAAGITGEYAQCPECGFIKSCHYIYPDVHQKKDDDGVHVEEKKTEEKKTEENVHEEDLEESDGGEENTHHDDHENEPLEIINDENDDEK